MFDKKKFDWRSPESDHEKGKLLHARFGIFWGDQRETDLIYEVGDVDGLTRAELFELNKEFLRGCQADFKILEFTRGEDIPGQPMLMRIKGMLHVLPRFQLRDVDRPLLQMGYPYPTSQGPLPVVNFHQEWKRLYM